MLSITIAFRLSRRSAHDSKRDLLICEDSRDKSISVWVFILGSSPLASPVQPPATDGGEPKHPTHYLN